MRTSNRHLPRQELTHRLRGHVYVSLQAHLTHVDQPQTVQFLLVFDNLEATSTNGDDGSLLLNVDGAGIRIVRDDSSLP